MRTERPKRNTRIRLSLIMRRSCRLLIWQISAAWATVSRLLPASKPAGKSRSGAGAVCSSDPDFALRRLRRSDRGDPRLRWALGLCFAHIGSLDGDRLPPRSCFAPVASLGEADTVTPSRCPYTRRLSGEFDRLAKRERRLGDSGSAGSKAERTTAPTLCCGQSRATAWILSASQPPPTWSAARFQAFQLRLRAAR